MKFCTHCGKDVLDDALICPHCGCSVQYDEPQKNAGYSQQATYAPPVADNYSALSILGLVFSFFGGLLGLILSIVALNEAK